MMSTGIAYLPGMLPASPRPLARYLPPLPEGIVAAWLGQRVPPGSWVIDPFAASPHLAVEAARAGYKVLVAANNPISRFILEMAASPPAEADLRAVLADLAVQRRGEERIEPHIRSLYMTYCNQCGNVVEAEAFLWDRENQAPFARIFHCPQCGESGEHPVLDSDIENARKYAGGGLHGARALERVTALDDPDRQHVAEALEAYLPRAIYALFTLINKVDGMGLSQAQKQLLSALVLSACEQANSLWPYPTGRARPRQLTTPPRFRENNVWMALEQAIQQWTEPSPPVSLTSWPAEPPAEGGICLFEGRLKDLTERSPRPDFRAVVAVLPRPNQAFWTLSALWAGWLWGREAVGPFKSVLRRRRYDWAWHCSALHAAFDNLASIIAPGVPVWGLMGEAEPGFMSAALLAALPARLELVGLALRAESGQAQITWQQSTGDRTGSLAPAKEITNLANQAAVSYLKTRGEPAHYLPLHTAALSSLVQLPSQLDPTSGSPVDLQSPAEMLAAVNAAFEQAFSYRGGLLRYGGSEKSLEVGQWWLRELSDNPPELPVPLADRAEMELVRFLLNNQPASLLDIDSAVCALFPGMMTPGAELIQTCLESYATLQPPGSSLWQLRPEDSPTTRRKNIDEIRNELSSIGQRLGYSASGEQPLLWLERDGSVAFRMFIIASAIFGEIVLENPLVAGQSLIVLPGGRANLAAYKLRRNPYLSQAISQGWRFIKFRHVHRMAENPLLARDNLDEQFSLDPLKDAALQLRLL